MEEAIAILWSLIILAQKLALVAARAGFRFGRRHEST